MNTGCENCSDIHSLYRNMCTSLNSCSHRTYWQCAVGTVTQSTTLSSLMTRLSNSFSPSVRPSVRPSVCLSVCVRYLVVLMKSAQTSQLALQADSNIGNFASATRYIFAAVHKLRQETAVAFYVQYMFAASRQGTPQSCYAVYSFPNLSSQKH